MVLLGRPLAAEDHCGWPGSGQFRDVHGHKAGSPAATVKDITGKSASNPDRHSTDTDMAIPHKRREGSHHRQCRPGSSATPDD